MRAGSITCPATRQACSPRPGATRGELLDAVTLPELPREPKRPELRVLPPTVVPRDPTERERRRAVDYLRTVVDNVARMAPDSGRNNALNHAAWTLGHWVAAGALDQREVEDALYGAAERNGLVSDPKDGPRKTWGTIRSGLSKGLQQPVDLDADDRLPLRTRHRKGTQR
jgi:hypothetical protein